MSAGRSRTRRWAIVILCLALSVAAAVLLVLVFGAEQPPLVARLLSVVVDLQRDIHRAMTAQLSAVAADIGWRNAGVLLLGAFAYGVLHAIGPGHGKLVVTAWLAARPARLPQALGIAFGGAALQALAAASLVGLMSAVLGQSRLATLASARWLEIAAWTAALAVGLWLTIRALRSPRADGTGIATGRAVAAGPLALFACADCAPGQNLADTAPPGAVPGAARFRAEAVPRPPEARAVMIATGLRPCTGSILVLLFALSLGVPLLGAAAVGAIALGTGSTVALLAAAVVYARTGAAARLLGHDGAKAAAVFRWAAVAAGMLVATLAIAMIFATATAPRGPFGLPGMGA